VTDEDVPKLAAVSDADEEHAPESDEAKPTDFASPPDIDLAPTETLTAAGAAMDDLPDLPDYVVAPAPVAPAVADEDVPELASVPEAGEHLPETDEATLTPTELASAPEIDLDPVETRTRAVARTDELPDYVIAPAPVELETPAVPAAVLAAAPAVIDQDVPELDAFAEAGEEHAPETDEAAATSQAPTASFPALPSLDVRQEALDETDTALRKIRDQLGVDASSTRRRRVRRRFIVVSGVAAIAGLTALAAESQPQLMHLLPGWLGL